MEQDQLRLAMGNVLWKNVIRPYLYRSDAEDAHLFTVRSLRRMQDAGLLPLLKFFYRSPFYQMPLEVAGTKWRNPVGMAAGFDKHGEVIPALDALGFGSEEIGTFAPKPQFGNPQPRVFRYRKDLAIINRYGFNSVGAEVGARNYHEAVTRYRINMAIGVSIGKNKETPDEKAVDDYVEAFGYFLPYIRTRDWVKINISSPNTAGLRNIFERLDEFLGSFTERAKEKAKEFGVPMPRLVLKVPPDFPPDSRHIQLCRVVEVAARCGFVGIEATNTTTNEEIKGRYKFNEAGGLSGEPLRMLATSALQECFLAPAKGIDLIGVGGISCGEHALEKQEVGAKAVQVYTGLVFRGPVLIHEILGAWRNGG